MLGKLLKYDLKWCYKNLFVFYIITIIFSAITRIVEQFNDSFIFLILDKICCGIVISLLISIMINNFMRIWARVICNVYKDESYLTHTLPVSKTKIFLSKILASIITLATSFIVIIASIAITAYSKESWMYLKSSIENSAIYFDISVFSFVLAMVAVVFFEVLFMLLSGILGIVIGFKSNNFKILKSVIYGFMLYMIPSAISIVAIYSCGFFNPEIMNLFNNTTVEISASALKIILIAGIVIYIIYDILYYMFGNKVLNKGVNVD